MENYQANEFIFSPKYRVWRHVFFWAAQIVFFSLLWGLVQGLSKNVFLTVASVPLCMLYTYPLTYWILPEYLLKGKYLQFISILVFWIVAGYFINAFFRAVILIPLQDYMQFENISRSPWQPGPNVAQMATAVVACVVVLYKNWLKKQQEYLHAEKEKVTAELQLLKAQVHPHFLFNTLNNIYSFSLAKSAKTPQLILKLSSLLSYMLYDCKPEQVLLEKELEVMKDYVDLEKERYGNNIEISWNIVGNIKDKYIAPLLILPFLENAFKHGTAEQLEKPWLSMDLSIRENMLKCKIVNSKNEFVSFSEKGIGIENVKKRLAFIYPHEHELKINDEGDFFVVSLSIVLHEGKPQHRAKIYNSQPVTQNTPV